MDDQSVAKAFRDLVDLLKKHEPVLDEARRAEIEARYKAEKPELQKAAKGLLLYLVVVVVLFLSASVALALWGSGLLGHAGLQLALAIATGTLGSSVAALLSALDRRAHGWELSNGWKYPQPEPADKFQESMVPIFVVRPLLGSVMGLVLYLYPWPDKLTYVSDVSIGFWGFLLGFLAKSFLDVLKGVFKSVFGK